jgi:uncharacterized protein (DUF849 family)
VEKRTVTAAITGPSTILSLNPYLPVTLKQIADSAIEAAEAVTDIVHVHVWRPDDGYPSSDPVKKKDKVNLEYLS